MDKFLRNYRLFVGQLDGSKIEIDPPFTLEFDVSRNTLASANTANMRVYNLSESTRKKIYKDAYRYDQYLPVVLMAGYGDTMPVIFKGNIRHAWSVRESTNYVTTIDAFDGGDALINGQTNQSFAKGTPVNQMLSAAVGNLPNVSVGAIGNFPGKLARGNSVNGNSSEILKTQTNDGFFIDLEKAYCLNDNECILGSIPIITSDTGLLGTPIREQTTLTFDILFEPRILVAQKIELRSQTEKNYNGIYKVISLHHRGLISGSVAGTAVTTLGLWAGDKELTVVNG